MKAWVVEQTLGPRGLKLTEQPDPEPQSMQARLRIEACALGPADLALLRGEYAYSPDRPFSPGIEVAGTIDAVGAQSRWRVGERVFGLVPFGGLAERVVADDAYLHAAPPDVDAASCATLAVAYPSAWLALRELAQAQENDLIIVVGGAGAIGLAALQLASLWKIRSIALVSDSSKRALALMYGAASSISHQEAGWEQRLRDVIAELGGSARQLRAVTSAALPDAAVDVIVDPAGGAWPQRLIPFLGWQGRYMSLGFSAGRVEPFPVESLLARQAILKTVNWGETQRREPALARQILADVYSLTMKGAIRSVVTQRFGFDSAVEALCAIDRRENFGKTVVEINAA